MNRFLLVRHAENPANLTHEFSYKKIDYPLTEKGRLQAQQTAEHLQHQPVTSVYASPLKRTVETAEIIAQPHGLSVRVLEQFREVNIGDLEGYQTLMRDGSCIRRLRTAGIPENLMFPFLAVRITAPCMTGCWLVIDMCFRKTGPVSM